jgi:filamentous hemagglutinin family protein
MIRQLLAFLATTALFILPNIVRAQTYQPSNRNPLADNTLGTQVSASGNNFNITGGLNKGQTLFHSFSDFSIQKDRAANFINSPATRDIITRVTGNNFSDINGLINSNGANFFLINPNGVTFGTNAQLNVGRAFMASTANGINLVDAGGRAITFGTNPNGDAPLLSIAPNVLFNVSSLNVGGGAGQINNFGKLENATPNQTQYIGLIGGNVNFNGGQILAPGANIELGGLRQAGTVGFSIDRGIQLPDNVARGNVSLMKLGTSPSFIYVLAGGGGNVRISAQDVDLQGTDSFIATGIAPELGSPTAQAGDIKLDTTGKIAISESTIFNGVARGGVGKGGNIEITTGNLAVSNGAVLDASTFGTGDAGNVKTIATGNISFDGGGALSIVRQGAVGKSGGVQIITRNLSVTNGSQLASSTLGQGDAGNIKITATGDINFDGRKDLSSSSLRSTVQPGAVGKGGNIDIDTRNLSIVNGAQLNASTFGQGDAGNIKITATGDINFDGTQDVFRSGVFSNLEIEAVGQGGNINITTKNLYVTKGAGLVASTLGQGNAGNIKITATENASFDGGRGEFSSVALSQVLQGAEGKGGGVEISSGNLSVTNGAELSTSTEGKGDAGNIILKSNTINLNRGAISSQSTISTGGDINITTKDYLLLRNSSSIKTDSASTDKNGNGGNIAINSPLIIATPSNNDITANANFGNGGRVNITSQGLFGIGFRAKGQESNITNDITASSTFGQSGTVNIDTPGTDPGRDSTELPNAPNDASNQISQICSSETRQNKLTVTGRGGLPPNANEPLNSDVVWQDARAAKSQPAASNATTNPLNLPLPAVGWKFDGNGKVMLIAAGAEGQPTGTKIACPTAAR